MSMEALGEGKITQGLRQDYLPESMFSSVGKSI